MQGSDREHITFYCTPKRPYICTVHTRPLISTQQLHTSLCVLYTPRTTCNSNSPVHTRNHKHYYESDGKMYKRSHSELSIQNQCFTNKFRFPLPNSCPIFICLNDPKHINSFYKMG
ncbi:hypothetical protein CHS0354_035062 [Potamilus streckersoni]|uniref:Uncharacterized protein n=1 Tax=Potamilus streckersoni TaxID=2493646 RepID=A0AAE0S726_9BIVA|nr:hypothetical protein CHS0354_035062 [Potamilus streckersoni]